MTEQTSRLAIVIDSTGAKKDAESLTDALVHLATKGKLASEELDSLGNTADEQAESLRRLLRQVDPVGAAFEKLSKQRKLLQDAFDKKLLREDDFKRFDSMLSKQQNSLVGIGDQLNKTGMSAKQTAAAMRQVPMQFTDIFTSLAAGQPPLQVFLQQGGQLKDMFGGIGPAAKALGGYVAGLVTPFTLAAAAVGVLGVAYYQGSQEQDAFNRSLILTGNTVGKTSGQLMDMSRTIAQSTGATVGASAEVLNRVVSAGKIASGSLQTVSEAAVNMNKATGIAVDQLVGDFEKIAGSPTEAISKLNDQYHFLSLATYNQIRALEEQGNKEAAAKLATEEYASMVNSRADQIKQSLGLLETAWNGVWGAAKGAWDAMAGIGRESSIEDRIAQKQAELSRWTKDTNTRRQIQSELNSLMMQKQMQDDLNGARAIGQNANEKGIKAQEYVNALTKETLTNAQKRTKEQEKLTKAIADGAKISAEEEARLRKNIDEKYKDPKVAKGKAYTEDAATKLLDQLNQQTSTLQNQFETTEKIGSAQQSLIKWEQQLADIKTKKILTADQKSLLANQDSITAKYQENAALEKQVALRKELEKLTAFKNTLSSGLQNDAAMLQNSLNSNTVLSKEQKRQQELTKISTEFQKKQTELTNQRTTGQISGDLYKQETDALQAALNERLAMQQAYYMQLDQLNGNWQMGVQNGLQSYMNSVPSLYESVTAATTSILSTTETAISSNLAAMLQGTESLSDGFKNMATGMGQAVIEALTKMAAQWLVYQAVQMVVGKTAAVSSSSMLSVNAQAMAKMAELNAYASTAAIPIIGPGLALAAAGAAAAFAEPLAAAVGSISLVGMAHSGIDSVPSTGTWLLEKGERVMTAQTSARLDATLENLRKNGMDATLSKPGFGTGAQNVTNSNQSTTVFSPQINMPPITINGNPSDATLMAINQSNKQLAKQIKAELASEIVTPQGQFGNALKGYYSRSHRT